MEISRCEYFFAYHHAAMYFYKNQGTDVGGIADKATLDNFVIARGTLTASFCPLFDILQIKGVQY